MGKQRGTTIRFDDAWERRLDRLMKILQPVAKPQASTNIRRIVAREASSWLDCPYIRLRSENFVFVWRDGTVGFRGVDELKLQRMRTYLPASLTMKPEVKRHYFEKYRNEPDLAASIKKHWLLNYFAAWEEEALSESSDVSPLWADFNGEPIVEAIDRWGIESKSVALRIARRKDEVVLRETLVVLDDFVLRDASGDRNDDRGDVPLDIPTLNLDIRILVDRELYRESRASVRRHCGISYELRNNELARFEESTLGLEDNRIAFTNGSYPETTRSPTLQAVRESFESFRERLEGVRTKKVLLDGDRVPIVETEAARKRIASLVVPENFLYGHFSWPTPLRGIDVSVTWNKP